jgi:hypothetical protein
MTCGTKSDRSCSKPVGELHEVQATLGHTTIGMTGRYLNATHEGVKGAFKKIEAKRRRRSLRVVASTR